MFFPGELPLNHAMYVILAVTALYPILWLHDHQARQPHQPRQTGWLKSIGFLLMCAFHPEQLDPHMWIDEGPGWEYAEDMHHDISVLYEFLGLDDENNLPTTFALQPHLILCTPQLSCIICPGGCYEMSENK